MCNYFTSRRYLGTALALIIFALSTGFARYYIKPGFILCLLSSAEVCCNIGLFVVSAHAYGDDLLLQAPTQCHACDRFETIMLPNITSNLLLKSPSVCAAILPAQPNTKYILLVIRRSVLGPRSLSS
jgi:hypothetical protein